MLRAFLRWLWMHICGPLHVPQAGEQWLFTAPYKPGFRPVTVILCDGSNVWYVFESGLRADLDVRSFVAWYRRVG